MSAAKEEEHFGIDLDLGEQFEECLEMSLDSHQDGSRQLALTARSLWKPRSGSSRMGDAGVPILLSYLPAIRSSFDGRRRMLGSG